MLPLTTKLLGRKEGKGSTEGELSDGKKGNPFGDSGKNATIKDLENK